MTDGWCSVGGLAAEVATILVWNRRAECRESVRMASEPRVSVVIPTRNRRELVTRAVRSVLAQTCQPDEILVVDDGSQDGTAAAVRELSERVRCHVQPQQGVAAAYNAGLRRTSGDWVALLHDDDQWTPDKLEKSLAFRRQNPDCDVIYTGWAAWSETEPPRPMSCRDWPAGWMLPELFQACPIHDSTVLFRRSVWERMGRFDEMLPVCAGEQFWLRIAVSHKFGLLPEPLTLCQTLADGLSADRPRLSRIQAEIRHWFYEEQGQQRLDRVLVCRTMGRLCLQAAQLTWQQGNIALGARHYRGAALYRPTLRTKWLYSRAERFRVDSGLPAIETAVYE